MKSILVTGANGFIGQNLCSLLELKGYNVYKSVRDTCRESLIASIKNSNLCVHLAGEVRPNASKEQHLLSNTLFTKELVTLIGRHNPIPIIASSTIHAGSSNNKYGNSKKEAEEIIQSYSSESGAKSYLMKLPHVFGPLCKPNYNSVITTWIVNALEGKELTLYDEARDVEMMYLYVGDLCKKIIEQIEEEGLVEFPTSYKIKLYELKELILRLVKDSNHLDKNNSFQVKLLETIVSYRKGGHFA